MTQHQSNEVMEEVYGTWNRNDLTDDEWKLALLMVIAKLGCELVRTNATKHGNVEMVLRPEL